MAAVPIAARIASAAANALFAKNENEESALFKLIVGVVTGVVGFFLLCCAAVELYIIPTNALTEFFLPDSITEAKRSIQTSFDRPIIQTGQKGLLVLPVTNPQTSSPYGWRYLALMGGMNFHEGLDFPVALGTSVMAIAPGRVAECGVSRDYGDYIMLEHNMIRYDEDGEIIEEERFYSFYAHLYRRYVFTGQTVEQGREIALSGGDPTMHFAGNTTGAHLHLELRRTPEYATQNTQT